MKALTLLLLVVGTSRAWQVPLDERIKARTDPARAIERVRESSQGRGLKTQSTPRTVDEFSGKTHPELFLPYEVFRTLIQMAYLGNPRLVQVFPETKAEHIKALSLPQDFWTRLRNVSTVYISNRTREEVVGRALADGRSRRPREDQAELALLRQDLCRSQADALEAARREFGRERFDRFLYEAIAPNMYMAADTLPTKEQLLRVAGGCR